MDAGGDGGAGVVGRMVEKARQESSPRGSHSSAAFVVTELEVLIILSELSGEGSYRHESA